MAASFVIMAKDKRLKAKDKRLKAKGEITQLLNYFITPSLHYLITPLPHYSITSLLPKIVLSCKLQAV